MTEQSVAELMQEPCQSIPTSRALLSANEDAAFATVLRALQGHGTLDRAGLRESLTEASREVQSLVEGDRDAARRSLARMVILSETAAARYMLLAEQQQGQSYEIESRSALMRVALAAIRTHAQVLATLSALEVRDIG
jgi:hypothetical protein